MKRVRYLAGIAGLVPAAIATAPAAQAASARPAAVGHTGITAAPDTCYGNTYFTMPATGRVRGSGYYTDDDVNYRVCVGTVTVSLYFNKTFCKKAYFGISGIDNLPIESRTVCGHAGKWSPTYFAVDRWFTSSASVHAFSQYQIDPYAHRLLS